MKFRIRVKSNDSGSEWWEDFEREEGEAHKVRGYPQQPEFTGDPVVWGKAIIEWWNQTLDHPTDGRRTFLAAEVLYDLPEDPTTRSI